MAVTLGGARVDEVMRALEHRLAPYLSRLTIEAYNGYDGPQRITVRGSYMRMERIYNPGSLVPGVTTEVRERVEPHATPIEINYSLTPSMEAAIDLSRQIAEQIEQRILIQLGIIRPVADESIAIDTVAMDRTIKEQRAKSAQADARAEELLLSVLNEDQQIDYRATGSFIVKAASGWRYRIKCSYRAFNVFMLDAEGVAVLNLCAVSDSTYPACDQFALQKLAIQANEEAFRRTSNKALIVKTWRPDVQIAMNSSDSFVLWFKKYLGADIPPQPFLAKDYKLPPNLVLQDIKPRPQIAVANWAFLNRVWISS